MLVVSGLLERPRHVQRLALKVVLGAVVFAALAGVTDPEARKHYVEAFKRSYFDGMLNYYKANYPAPPAPDAPAPPPPPKVNVPVLMFHGLQDTALHSDGLNNTWDWVDADLTIVTTPNAAHFVQQDAADLVSSTLRWWLDARK